MGSITQPDNIYVCTRYSMDDYYLYEPKIKELLQNAITKEWSEFYKHKQLYDFNGLYVIFNKSNNRCYVGKSSCIYKRLCIHKSHALKYALQRKDNTIVKIIPLSTDDRDTYERWLIKYYGLRYNCINKSGNILYRLPSELNIELSKEEYDA